MVLAVDIDFLMVYFYFPACVDAAKQKQVYRVLLQFALKSITQCSPKDSLVFLMLIAQLCYGKDALSSDDLQLLNGVVNSYIDSLDGQDKDTKGHCVYCNTHTHTDTCASHPQV